MATSSACTQKSLRPQVEPMRSPRSSGRLLPVTMPSLAERYWMSHAITLPSTTIHTSRNPNAAPAVMLLATLPGSR